VNRARRSPRSTTVRAVAIVSVALLVGGLGGVWPCASVRADAAAESRFFDELARRAFAAGAYAEALDAFLLAHGAAPSPSSAFNVAGCAALAEQPALGYQFFRTFLELAPESDTERRAQATRQMSELAERLALFEVSTTPPGASVFVDSVELGRTGVTPCVVAVEPGAHALILQRDGHRTAETRARTRRGHVTRVEETLSARTGELSVTTEPSGAEVVVSRGDGVLARVTTPANLTLPAGTIAIRASIEGHVPSTESILVEADARASLALTLEALPGPTGTLLVSTGGVAARVRVDGRDRAETPATLRRVPVGHHLVEVTASGRATLRREVEVDAERPQLVELSWGVP
jgi:hypothetical protein